MTIFGFSSAKSGSEKENCACRLPLKFGYLPPLNLTCMCVLFLFGCYAYMTCFFWDGSLARIHKFSFEFQ